MGENILCKINDFILEYDTYRARQFILVVFDIIILVSSFIFSMFISMGSSYMNYTIMLPVIVALFTIISLLIYFRCYSNLWYGGIDKEIICIFISVFLGSIADCIVNKILNYDYSVIFYIMNGLITLVGIMGIRVSYRVVRRVLLYFRLTHNEDESSRVLIIGAGSAGQLILKEIFENPQLHKFPVGIVDDDLSKLGKNYYNVQVIGNTEEIKNIVEKYKVDEIIFSIAKIDKTRKSKIIEICKDTKCKLKTIPGLYEMIDGKVSIKTIRDVNIEDLLGRQSIELENPKVKRFIRYKKVLITGAGGSIGSELCRQVAKLKPRELILLDIYENNVYDVQQELIRKYGQMLDMKVLIASVRDEKRIEEIFRQYKPEIVFHAAAHKHVPLMEDSPCEAVKNNVFGTLNVANLASKYKVERFVLISTDKAVNPTNIMGATKRCCEMIVQTMNQDSHTEFVAVRFGNVLGSNGSVVPLFKKQIEQGGPVKVTHEEITRFFMTIPEAVSLVMEAGAIAKGGEIFVLNMGEPVKIMDLARNLITLSGFEPDADIKIEVTGLRPGEKLYEEILMEEEGLKSTENEKIHIGKPIDIDKKFLLERLAILKEVASREDDDRVRYVMKSLVDTYVIPVEREVLDEPKITVNA